VRCLLHAAGILIFATDEPIDAHAPEAAGILVRRMKQGIAEYFRYNTKTPDVGRPAAVRDRRAQHRPLPLRLRRGTHRPPDPMKASVGATQARLVPDPERGPWVARIYEWRVYEKLSVDYRDRPAGQRPDARVPLKRGQRARAARAAAVSWAV
jgi:hypothetical protein